MSTLASRIADADAGYVLDAQGLVVTGELSRDDWDQLGRRLATQLQATQWAIGDWLVYAGRDSYLHFDWYGSGQSSYDRAAQITGLSVEKLGRYYTVAKAFPRGARQHGISWTHHQLAKDLPAGERAAILTIAARDRWTCVQLTAWLAAKHPVTAQERFLTPPRQAYQRREVECPQCQHRFAIGGHSVPREDRR